MSLPKGSSEGVLRTFGKVTCGRTFGRVPSRAQITTRAVSSAGLEHMPYTHGVGGSNPSLPTMFYTYVLLSLKTGRYYVGSTSHLDLRIDEHNGGKTVSTRTGIPWRLVYSEEFDSRKKAVARERHIKSQKSKTFIEHLILKNSTGPRGQLV